MKIVSPRLRAGFMALAVTGLVGGVIAATPLLAAPADTIRGRIAGYRALGAAFKTVNDQLRAGGAVNTVPVRQAARTISATARNQYGWFPAGTGPQAGVKTRATSNIWSQPAQFRLAQQAFEREARRFEGAVASGNADLIRGAARDLGGTCKSCHDSFRGPE